MANAKLLIDFNISTGILPTSGLRDALEAAKAAEAKGELTFWSEEAATLREEVSRMVAAIKPSTIRDIRNFAPYTSVSEKRKTNDLRYWWGRLRPFVYFVASFIIVATCAYLTVWARDAEQLVRDVQTVQQRLASDALQTIVERWAALPPDGTAEASEAPPMTSGGARREFRVIGDHLETFNTIARRVESLNARLPSFRLSSDLSRLPAESPATEATPDAAASEAPQTQEGEPPGQPPAGSIELSDVAAGSWQSYIQSPDSAQDCLRKYEEARRNVTSTIDSYTISSDEGAAGRNVARFALSDWASEQMYNIHLELMRCTLRLDPQVAARADLALGSNFYVEQIRSVRNRVDTLSTWLLPALYGMLGAIFMNLQFQQDPLHPPQPDGRIVSRVFLGGFIGLIIGWFWSPRSGDFFEFANVNLGLFTVAFVFGYGADVFMSLLQRMVQKLGAAVESTANKA